MSTPGLHSEIAGRGECPELMQLAAFADGRAEESAQSALAQHIAGCDRCADVVSSVLGAEDDEKLIFVPPTVASAAKSLVEPQGEIRVVRHARRFPRNLQRFAAAAAALAICAIGYQVGASLNTDTRQNAADQLAMELSFELYDQSDADDEELPLFSLNTQGVAQ
jgi:anti-sigma factor RsiW